MKGLKKLCFVILTAALCALPLAACAGNVGAVTFEGVEVLRFKEGEATDAKLLEGVTVKSEDGTTAAPTLKAENVDYSKAGAYNISYVYGNREMKTVLYVYGMPELRLNGTAVGSSVDCSFSSANGSFDFVKGITAVDSFGETLEVTKTDGSDKFGGKAGEYRVTYKATDAVGNSLEQTVAYNVSGDKTPVIENYTYEVGTRYCDVPLDLKGETRGRLYLGGELVNPSFYEFTSSSLRLNLSYILGFGETTSSFELKTAEGSKAFNVTVEDNGKPLFEIRNFSDVVTEGTVSVEKPVKVWSGHADYKYTYSLTGGGKPCYVEENADGLLLIRATGDDLAAGDGYTLSVTATSADGTKTTKFDYPFDVAAATDPQIRAGERSTFTEVELDESVYGVDSAMLWEKSAGAPGWDGRLQMTVPAKKYMAMTFDMYIESADGATEDNKANISLRGETTGKTSVTDGGDNYIKAYNYNAIDRDQGVFDKAAQKFVELDDIEVGKWYTVLYRLSKESSGSNAYLFMDATTGKTNGVKVYMKDIKFHKRGDVTVTSPRDVANPNVTGNFTPVLLNESVYGTDVAYCWNQPTGISTWDGRLDMRYEKTERAELKFEVYFEQMTAFGGTSQNNKGLNIYNTTYNLINNTYGVVETATGAAVNRADMTTGKWYSVTVDMSLLSGVDKSVYFYYNVEKESGLKAYFKDFRYEGKIIYDGPRVRAQTKASRAGFELIDASGIAGADGDTVWKWSKPQGMAIDDAGIVFTNTDYTTLKFDFYVASSTKADAGKANVKLRGAAGDYVRIPEQDSVVKKGTTEKVALDDLEVGRWYTVTMNLKQSAYHCIYLFSDELGAVTYVSNFTFIK